MEFKYFGSLSFILRWASIYFVDSIRTYKKMNEPPILIILILLMVWKFVSPMAVSHSSFSLVRPSVRKRLPWKPSIYIFPCRKFSRNFESNFFRFPLWKKEEETEWNGIEGRAKRIRRKMRKTEEKCLFPLTCAREHLPSFLGILFFLIFVFYALDSSADSFNFKSINAQYNQIMWHPIPYHLFQCFTI